MQSVIAYCPVAGLCLHTQSLLVAGRNNFALQSSWQLIKKIVEQGIYPAGSSSRKFKSHSLKFFAGFHSQIFSFKAAWGEAASNSENKRYFDIFQGSCSSLYFVLFCVSSEENNAAQKIVF